MSDEIKILKSTVTDFNDHKMDFNNNNNPLMKNLKIDFDNMVGYFVFTDGKTYDIRMPDKRKVKRFKRVSKKAKILMNNINTSQIDKMDVIEQVEDAQESMIEDMIIDFKFDDHRMDDKDLLDLTSLVWEFYAFLSPRLEQLGEEYSSSIKG